MQIAEKPEMGTKHGRTQHLENEQRKRDQVKRLARFPFGWPAISFHPFRMVLTF